MNLLREIWDLAKSLNPYAPMAIPYHDLRRFFQLGSLFPLHDGIEKANPCAAIPHDILVQAGLTKTATLFDSAHSSITAGRYLNEQGGSIIHGEITTHGHNGHGATQYVYVAITGHTAKSIIPYFIYLGQVDTLAELNKDTTVTTITAMGLLGLDEDMTPVTHIISPSDYARVNHALAAGNAAMLLILGNILPHPSAIGEVTAQMGTLKCIQQFDYHAGTRTPQSLTAEVQAMLHMAGTRSCNPE